MRCTIFTKLPVAFSGGRSESREPVGVGRLNPRGRECLTGFVYMDVRAIPRLDMTKLGFLVVSGDPDVVRRNDRQQCLSG